VAVDVAVMFADGGEAIAVPNPGALSVCLSRLDEEAL
jgi:hypothetical protein